MDLDRVPPRGWLIVFLLSCFMLINFADKAVLGLAAVPNKQAILEADIAVDH